MISALFSTPALAALNHVLDQAGWARRKLQPFAGRHVCIAMQPFSLLFEIGGDGYLLASDASADLDIVLPAETPLLAWQGGEQVMKAVRIDGPAELANTLSFVLRHLRWDIEEDLSKVFGDIIAHRMTTALHGFASWQRQAAQNLAGNLGEYLIEENPTLVKSAELEAFADDAARLRVKLATMEARINRLQEKSS